MQAPQHSAAKDAAAAEGSVAMALAGCSDIGQVEREAPVAPSPSDLVSAMLASGAARETALPSWLPASNAATATAMQQSKSAPVEADAGQKQAAVGHGSGSVAHVRSVLLAAVGALDSMDGQARPLGASANQEKATAHAAPGTSGTLAQQQLAGCGVAASPGSGDKLRLVSVFAASLGLQLPLAALQQAAKVCLAPCAPASQTNGKPQQQQQQEQQQEEEEEVQQEATGQCAAGMLPGQVQKQQPAMSQPSSIGGTVQPLEGASQPDSATAAAAAAAAEHRRQRRIERITALARKVALNVWPDDSSSDDYGERRV